jgi:hypothetical protein
VEVDDDHRRARPRVVDELVHELPRRLRDVEEERAEQVHDRDRDAVPRLHDGEPVTGRPRAGVRRADHGLAAREILADPVAAVRVIAERDDVCAGGEQLVRELRRDARAVGDVLAVDDADVGVELRAQGVQPFLDGTPPGDAEDVREKEESQLRMSDAAGRSSIETWFPASFV